MVKKAFLIFPLVLLLAASAYGGGLALSGVGSKAICMGGAFRGLADNWSAAYWNPAGLAQLTQTEFNLMAIAINPMPEYNPDIWYTDSNGVSRYNVGYKNGEVRYPHDKTSFAPNVSGFYKMSSREDLTFGVAIFVPYALGSEWDLFDPVYEDIIEPYPGYDHKSSLHVIDFHPSIAKSLMDGKLMVGAGLSIMKGEIEFQRANLSATGLPYPHDNVAVDAFLKGDGWGYGANFGVLYKYNDKLQVGISGKTPTTLKLDGTANFDLYSIDNYYLWATAMSNAATADDSAMVDYIFSPSVVRTWTNDVTADLKLPADIGIGFAYSTSEKLLLTMDFTYTLWSCLDSIIVDLDEISNGTPPPVQDPTDTLMIIRTTWENTFRFSIGGQYQVSDPLALRFGFYLDPTPIPDETFSPLFMDIGAKYSGNIGAAYKVNNWELGYNFEYIHFVERDIPLDASAGTEFDNYPGLFKAYLIANHLSITYRF